MSKRCSMSKRCLFEPKYAEYSLVVVGAGRVGKTALIRRLVKDQFTDEYDPTINESYRKQVVMDGEPCFFDIVDIAAMDEYSAIREQYLLFAEGVLLLFDLNNKASLEIVGWYQREIRRLRAPDKAPMVLVGTKCDLRWASDKDRVQEIARTYGIPFVETSAKTGMGVDEAFYTVAREIRIERLRREEERRVRIRRNNRGLCGIL